MNGKNLSLLLLLLTSVAGCSRNSASFVLNDDVDIHKDIVAPLNSLALVCPATAMVFLIGSSEIVSGISKWEVTETGNDRVTTERRQLDNAEKFKKSIDKAKSDLTRGFEIDPKCPDQTTIAFISIIDHYQKNDSSIESIVYKKTAGTWRKQPTRFWQLRDSSLVAESGPAELDTSKDVVPIIKYFTSNKISKIENSEKLVAGFETPEQISYIVKTHGGRVATNPEYQPLLSNITSKPRAALQPSDWEPAILVDRIGASGPLTSEVFSAHWTNALLQTAVTAGDGDATSGDHEATSGDYDSTSGEKSLSFKESLVIQDSSTDYLGKMNWGAYATYGSDTKDSFKFPVAGKKSSNTPKNLIIMDSCHASYKILQALAYNTSSTGNTVVLASTSPIYFEFLDYSHFNTANFLKFPRLLENLEKNAGLSPAEIALRDNLLGGTLDWINNKTEVTRNFKKLEIWLD